MQLTRSSSLAAAALLAAVLASAAEPPFELRVRNSQPARYYLTDSAGKSFTPRGAISYEKRAERHFIAQNGFEIQLPAGTYTLVAERGPEFLPVRKTVQGRPGERKILPVDVVRWIDMNGMGWFSGDLHNHRQPAQMPALLLAEDLNLAPTLADWVWDDGQASHPPDTVDAVRPVDATHVYSVLDKEVERLKSGPGAVDLLGLRSRIPFDGYLLYPPNDAFARAAHAQGGWVDAEKIVWRDIAALVALGHVDSAGIVHNHFNRQDVELETDAWGMIPKDRPEFNTPAGMPLWAMDVYYRLLNCGFRLSASAGSATGVKAAPLGYNRVYVKPRGQFGYETWFSALKEGRTFATNGPMLFLTVEGREPGETLRLPPGAATRVRIRVEASSAKPMDRVEVLFKGRTIHTVTGRGRLAADFTAVVEETGWFAARAFEKFDRTARFAHTSPIYIEYPGDRGIVARDAQFFIDWIDREMAFYREAPGFREPRHREAMLALFSSARKVYVELANPSAPRATVPSKGSQGSRPAPAAGWTAP